MLHALQRQTYRGRFSINMTVPMLSYFLLSSVLSITFIILNELANGDAMVHEDNFEANSSLAGQVCADKLRVFTIEATSAIGCVFTCSKTVRCSGSWYHSGTRNCYGCVPNINPALSSLLETVSGAVYHRRIPKGIVCKLPPQNFTNLSLGDETYDFLVSGFLAVPRSHLLSSSVKRTHRQLTAKYAQLCGYIWAPARMDTSQWIQAKFLDQSNVFAVATRGSEYNRQYVKTYKVLYSNDCARFVHIKDTNGTQKVFDGNTNDTDIAINVLVEPVTALCLRINPTAWYDFIAMRIDVIGHIL